MFETRADSDFVDPGPYALQRFPVAWHEPALHSTQLVTRESARLGWKGTEVLEGGSEPDQRFVEYLFSIHQFVYVHKGCLTWQ